MPEPTPAPKRTRNRTAPGNTRTITLHSGGTLTLSGSFSFLELSPQDREFIFQLADTMTKYQQAGATVGQGAVGRPTANMPPAPPASAPAKGVN